LRKIICLYSHNIILEHRFLPYFDIGDSGFNVKKNFHHIRSTHSIPIIDYNKRGKKTDIETLKRRGYDEKGTPFAHLKGYYVSPMDVMRRKEEYPLFVKSSV